jgi:hypothetical protein
MISSRTEAFSFSRESRSAWVTTKPPTNGYCGEKRRGAIFHRELSDRDVRMAAHFNQDPRFKIRGVIPPLHIPFHGMALHSAQGQLSLNSTLPHNILF